ncbi:MAG: S8 family serine peptidase [Clostridia bacterium]|nr:S8 family serine peptidase [Clostridia bacterium]
MKRKILSLIIAVLMVLGLVSSFGGAETARPMTDSERAAKIEALQSFSEKVAGITMVYDKDIEAKKGEGEFALCRIIVKAAGELHDETAAAEAGGYNDWHVFQYRTPEEAEAAMKRFELMDEVEWAEPDEIMYAFATPGSNSFKSWGFGASHINMYEYNQWLYGEYGSNLANLPEIVVAVIDTGADSDHPFLVDRLVPGWNFVDNTNNPEDGHSHGTHVCGTVVDGTFSNVKIMPIKVLSDSGSGSTLNVGLGMEYGSLHGAKVENMSLGGGCDGGEEHHFMAEIVDEAFDRGTTIVVAAGNESQDAANVCPANIRRLCTVASIGQSHSLSYFSNFGELVDVAAPGESISSSVPGGGYDTKDGTSMASPHVAAVAAQIRSAHPEMSADEVITVIKAGAKAISVSNAGTGMAYLSANMFDLDPAVNAEGQHNHYVSTGSYVWTVDGSSAVSGNAGVNSSTAVMKTELTVGAEQSITFDYKVSSEAGADFFRVKANGTVIFESSGEHGWTTETVALPGSGSIQLTFEYYKNASGASGSDKAWVRNVKVMRSLSSAANVTGGTVPFASSGNYPWIVNDAENAAMSGNTGVNNSESVMTAQVNISKGMLITFKYKVEAASGDMFKFLFDGRQVFTSGATDGYVDYEYIVPSQGDHVLSFVFTKNASGAAGADAAFIKYFSYYHTFESAVNVEGGSLPFVNEAEYPWFAMQDYVSSSNWGEHSTSSYFTLDLPMHAGETLSFRYMTSSESNYDFFRFYVDGVKQTELSGTSTAWRTYTFTASADKTYSFKWSFEKDNSDPWYSSFDDAAYVDDVAYSGVYSPADGDVNNDGVADSLDALLVLRYSMNLIDGTQLDLARGDVNNDGVVDSLDALLILRDSMNVA